MAENKLAEIALLYFHTQVRKTSNKPYHPKALTSVGAFLLLLCPLCRFWVGTTYMSIGKSTFLKIAISFTSLIPCLISPTDDRERSASTPCPQKVTFVKIGFLKRLTLFLEPLTYLFF